MIITPLEVFVDIHSYLDSNKTKDSTQLLSVEQDASSTSYLVVKDIAYDPNFDNMASTRLPYSDCQYVKANEPAHTDRLEQLARDTLQGYNSAGIFINSRGNNFDDNWRDMTYIVLEQLAYQLNNKNKQYAEDGVPLIKMEYGFIGFYDEHCYDYLNKRAIKNDEAIQLYLHSLLQPVDKIGDVFDLIGSTPRLQPTLLVFHLTNHNKFESTFAWVDLLPPSTPDTQRSYNNCYSEFVNITKEYTKSKRNEFMPTTNYPMTHFLLDYFSGSYQTMAFAHFEEYGTYDTNYNMDILQYTSALQNIKCYVNNEPSKVLQSNLPVDKDQTTMLQEELKKRDLLLDHYKSLYIQRQDEIDELKNKAGTTEFIREKLISTRNTTNATLKRYDTKYEVQLAEMRHVINQLEISLAHTKVSAMSYKLTLEEKESELAQLLETQNTNQELSKLLESSTTFMDGSLAEITRLQAQVKSLEADRNPDQRTKFLRKKLKDMEHQVKNLTNNVDALTVERERLIANNEALNNEIITVVEKMTRLHDLEIQALKKQL